MSVIDDPLSRLYAGALLGKALTKEIGQVGAQKTIGEEGRRRATLVAGVASGKVHASSLGPGDAALLGQALHRQHITSDPFGFLTHFAGNLAKGAGEFAESLPKIPQGLYSLGKAAGEEIGHALTPPQLRPSTTPLQDKLAAIGKGVASDFSSPRQIYEHPFNPLLDVATLASGGAAAASKLAISGKLGKTLTAAGEPTFAGKLVKLTGTTGRAPARVATGFSPEQLQSLGEQGIKPTEIPRQYSPYVGMKYGVQKPLDFAVSKLRRVQIPGVQGGLGDLQGRLAGRKFLNRQRAKIAAGTSEAFMTGPAKDYAQTVERMMRPSVANGQMQHEAMILHSFGINDTRKLDEYAAHVKNYEDVDGPKLTADERAMADYRVEELYQDPRFRDYIDRPTDMMKEAAFHLRRMAVDNAVKLGIDPTVSENSALGRLRELTGKTNEEIKSELPASLRPQSEFARGLQVLQEHMLGHEVAEAPPTVAQLAHHLPYGSVSARTQLIQRAMDSLAEDIRNETTIHDRREDPNYLDGNNLFDKIASGLHYELGVPMEQAQAFARGVSLGTPEGAITPTYVPSVSSELMHFGLRREAIRMKIGRNLGLAKLKTEKPPPGYYESKRPFNPRSVSARTIGLGPSMNYTRDATYKSFLAGVARFDPEAVIRNAYHIQHDLVSQKLNDKMIGGLAVKGADGTPLVLRGPGEMIDKLGTAARNYTFVPVDTWRHIYTAKNELQADMGNLLKQTKDMNDEEIMQYLDELADENAQALVSGEVAKAAHGKIEGYALPTTFTKTIIEHARMTEQGNAIGRSVAFAIGRWKAAVLSYMPAWFMRTVLGHGMIAVIDGTVNPRYWRMAHTYFQDRPVLGEDVRSLREWRDAGDHQMMFEHPPPGQQAAMEFDNGRHTDYINNFDLYSRNPEVGAHLYRGELRRDPIGGILRDKSAGMHWTVNPNAVINLPGETGEANVVYRSILEDPQNQAIPRSHPIFQGRSRTSRNDFEVRLHPNVQARVTGAWVWRGKGEPVHFWIDKNGVAPEGWEFRRLDQVVKISHAPDTTGSHINYDRFPELFAAEHAPTAKLAETMPLPVRPREPGKLPPGVNQGGMLHELADVGQGAREAHLALPARVITGGVHSATNFQRRAIFLRQLDRGAKQRLAELGKDFEHPGGFWNLKNVDAVLDPEFNATVLQHPDLIEHAFDQLSKVSYTFGEMSPWERKLVKYGMPFWGWYKFITKFVWSMPINYPGRSVMLSAIGKIGGEEDEKLGPMPDYLSGALWFDHSDLAHARYVNLYGLNPLSDPAQPFGSKGALEGMLRLGQFSPVFQAGLAAFGINPLTGGTYGVDPRTGIETGKYGQLYDTKTGRELPNVGAVNPIQRFVGTFLRAFPEIRGAELLTTGGRPVYPESIPFISEHPIAVKPQSRHGQSPLSFAEQLGGIQRKEYDLGSYQAKLLKEINLARKKNIKTIAKAQGRLAEP